MSSKKQNANSVDLSNKTKGSGTQGTRTKNRRRSTRNTSLSNGDIDNDIKDRSSIKRGKENISKFDDHQEDLYKDIIDLVPSSELNCSPAEIPAPPGTRVNLHGVILHETEGGLIVLNVRWRNKIYSGALIDVEKSKWATDRVGDCNGGDTKDAKEFQTPPPIKKIKIPTSVGNQALEENEYGNKKKVTSPTTPSKTKTRTNGKKRNNQDRGPSPLTTIEETVPIKKHKIKVTNHNGSSPVVAPISNNTDTSLECPEPNCGKKYKTKNSLTYHIRRIHQKSDSLDDSGKENKSESHDDSDSGDDNFVIDEQADEDGKNDVINEKPSEEQNGSQSDDDNSDGTKKEELTENEKQIEKLKIETEKNLAKLLKFKKEKPDMETEKKDEIIEAVHKNKENSSGSQIPKEEAVNEQTQEIRKSSTIERENSNETIIDVENTKTPLPEEEDKKPIPSIQVTSAAPMEQIQQTVSTTIKKEDETYPRGSSKTTFQQDPQKALTELFAPANHSFHQFSPTLANLNPQKINESLTDALSKQQEVKTVSAFKATSKLEPDTIKIPLTPKPSIEIKPIIETHNLQMTDQDKKMRMIGSSNELIQHLDPNPNSKTGDFIPDSDNEELDLPDEILTSSNEIYPQNDRDVKPFPMFPNELIHPLLSSSFTMNFDKKMIFEKLTKDHTPSFLSKLSPTNIPLNAQGKSYFQDLFLSNPSDILAYLKQNSNAAKDEIKVIPGTNTGQFPLTESQAKSANRTPLLQQRLLSENIVSMPSSPGSNKMIPLTSSAQNSPLSRQINKEEFMSNNELKVTTEKSTPANMIPTRDRNFEKQKLSPGNLRINPPNKITGNTWIPEISKDSFNSGQSASTFRVPATKSLSVPGIPVSIVNDPKLNQLKNGKRPNQPVPIAPAPSPGNPIPRNEFPPPSSEYTSPEAADKDSSLFSCFTLTSDKRLISSTPDNRGRPRKTRGKIQQIPIGTHQDIGKVVTVGDMSLTRKPSASPVVRASVIQGSTHPSLDLQSSSKSPERMSAEAHAMLARNFENVEERFAGHPSQVKQIPSEMRSAAEKYKGLSSPPGVYYNPPPRNLLSPQNPRPSSRSPRQEFPRASPNIKSDLFRDPAFQQRALEHARSKPDILCAPEPILIPEGNRKHSISTNEALQMMNAYTREKDRLAAEFHNSQGRFQHQRPEIPHPHEISNALLERRYTKGEKEHARLFALERDLMLHQNPLPQGVFQRSGSPPPIPPNSESSGHHNLYLERRDGAYLGSLSSFQNRVNEPHKR